MGKRSDFKRRARDYYVTPAEAVVPLLPYLQQGTQFVEPCAGDGTLIDLLTEAGHDCVEAWDIKPKRQDIFKADASIAKYDKQADWFITNPPWRRKFLHPIICNLSNQLPTWLLFDADWIHTKQSALLMPRLRKIVSVGRIKWIPGTDNTGKDNCAWYLFDKNNCGPTTFHGRTGL